MPKAAYGGNAGHPGLPLEAFNYISIIFKCLKLHMGQCRTFNFSRTALVLCRHPLRHMRTGTFTEAY